MKRTMLLILLLLAGASANAQKLKNYDGRKNPKSLTDYVAITVITLPSPTAIEHHDMVSAAVASIVTAAVTLGIDFVNAEIAKKQASYTASYSNSISPAQLSVKDFLDGTHKLCIQRYAVSDKREGQTGFAYGLNSSNAALMATYIFSVGKVDSNENAVIHLDTVIFKGSKARAKSREDLSVAINIKLTAKSSAAASKNDTSASSNAGASIIIPFIRIGDSLSLVKPATRKNDVSMINDGLIGGLPLNTTDFSISASFTEANLNHLSPSTVSTLLKNNSADITGLVKSILTPSSSSSGSSGSK